MITDEDAVFELKDMGYHYNPKNYLSKYLFSKEVLLNIFCSEELVSTYEDYYNDDIDLEMIQKYQPHIDIVEFRILWNHLNEIRKAEYFCYFVKQYPRLDISYRYNIIEYIIQDYKRDTPINKIIDDFKTHLLKNTYIQKYYSLEKIKKVVDLETMKQVANEIISGLPNRYSDILVNNIE
jgi:hypothetical protein